MAKETTSGLGSMLQSGARNRDEPTRFGRYARRLWDPLLAVEEFSDR